MSLRCGIVGLPNAGKSTLFNALTNSSVPASNYPFCTINPNIGIVEVPDTRLAILAELVKPQNIIANTVEFVDIAGLVKNASSGEGLGNQFLANIRETDAIINLIRCFEDDDIIHVNGKVSPVDDLEIINLELIFADLTTLENQLLKKVKNQESGLQELIKKLISLLKEGKAVRDCNLNNEELQLIKPLCLLTAKPILYVANIKDFQRDQKNINLLEEYLNNKNLLTICATLEAEITGFSLEDKKIFLQDQGISEPSLNRLIVSAYSLLGLQTYFTAGVKEVRAWTIKINTNAAGAAGVIHTDFEKGFIRAEVISFDDFVAYKGELGAKNAGKMRLEGKEYLVKDGDIMHFRFNV